MEVGHTHGRRGLEPRAVAASIRSIVRCLPDISISSSVITAENCVIIGVTQGAWVGA
jgi:hypothetical protein